MHIGTSRMCEVSYIISPCEGGGGRGGSGVVII